MFTDTNYVPVVITLNPNIGEAGKSTAYVRKFNAAIDTDPYDRDTPYIAISSRCAHLGCPVRWVDAAERFICPCHGGVYDLLGRRVGGPPVRPLDRFYTRVTPDAEVELGPRFSVNSELQALLAARSRRAAGRHRPVRISVASGRAETLGTVPKLPKLPAPPSRRAPGARRRAPATATARQARSNRPPRPARPSSTGSTSAPR